MKQVIPYATLDEALISLDNGGRFYNLFTEAEDDQITAAELGKVAGVFSKKQMMILFLELSISQLDATLKESVISRLTPDLKLAYEKYTSRALFSGQALTKDLLSSNIIIKGIPQIKESKNYFTGMILIPVGKVMVPVPLSDLYVIYEVRDELSSETVLMAHSTGGAKLPEKPIYIGGVCKQLKPKNKEMIAHDQFLEINYYTEAL